MRPVRRLIVPLLSLLAGLPLAAQAADARVIVKYKAGSELLRKQAQSAAELPALRAQALGQRTGLALRSGLAVSERSQVVYASGLSSEALAAQLAQAGDVEYAVPDRRKRIAAVPNDPLYAPNPVPPNGPAAGQWYLKAPTNTLRSAINAEAAWDLTTPARRAGVVVAVLDTGIRPDHRDLAANLLPGYDMIGVDRDDFSNSLGTYLTANDNNGRDSNPEDPGDWITLEETSTPGGFLEGCSFDEFGNPAASDSSWHGTEVAGLISALTDNGRGMASVGRNVKIVPVRVLGKCGGWDSDILAGMRWAAGLPVGNLPANPNPAQVINMSLGGGSGCSNAYVDAVNDIVAAGTSIVVSAGNGYGGAVAEPAGCAGVIAVAGVRHLGTKVGYSDLGSEVAISAPGGNCVNTGQTDPCLYPILSTTNTGTRGPVSNANGGSTYSDGLLRPTLGTSFSAPLVAGTAALMLAVEPDLSPAEVRSILRSTARRFPTSGAEAGTPQCHAPDGREQDECYCTTTTCGAGMLDARAAVAAAGAPPATGGGGGGGALGGGWLLLLGLASLALRRAPR